MARISHPVPASSGQLKNREQTCNFSRDNPAAVFDLHRSGKSQTGEGKTGVIPNTHNLTFARLVNKPKGHFTGARLENPHAPDKVGKKEPLTIMKMAPMERITDPERSKVGRNRTRARVPLWESTVTVELPIKQKRGGDRSDQRDDQHHRVNIRSGFLKNDRFVVRPWLRHDLPPEFHAVLYVQSLQPPPDRIESSERLPGPYTKFLGIP